MVYEESVVVSRPFAEVVEDVKEAFAAQGFGTLTEIDLQATLRQKAGKEIDPYVIVGACNPDLASRAIDALPQVGVLLPCNVVVRQVDDEVVIEAMDPGLLARITDHDDLTAVADEARRRIGDALTALAEAG